MSKTLPAHLLKELSGDALPPVGIKHSQKNDVYGQCLRTKAHLPQAVQAAGPSRGGGIGVGGPVSLNMHSQSQELGGMNCFK